MFTFYVLLLLSPGIFSTPEDEAKASNFHDNIFEPQSREWKRKHGLAGFEYETNVTEENARKLNEVSEGMATFLKKSWKHFTSYDWRHFTNQTLQRLFRFNSKLGISALDEDKFAEITEIVNNMTGLFGKITVCDYKNREKCDLHLNPEILETMSSSRNYNELLYLWEEWHNHCGRPMKELYVKYVSLRNEAARLNGFPTSAEMWIDEFDSDTFEEDIEAIWQQLKPYFEELHAFVRRRLIGVYGEDKVRNDGPIPAHLLGDQWAQMWTNIYDILIPFPNRTTLQITENLQNQGYTVKKMMELSESFYLSLGLPELPESFWRLSMMTRPSDRDVVCHASAWHLQHNDVRIKMCTKIEMKHLYTMHHELGHVHYYLQYNHQPTTFQQAANPGFHEAIGDTVVLSVATPKHLKKVGLLSDFHDDEEFHINVLMLRALDSLASLPFSYLVDKWRWKVFRGEITPQNYNQKWWELSKYYQGIEPSSSRTEMDFDPGVKLHLASDDPFISYFVSTILEYQFHEALCRIADQFDPQDPEKPLHKCDIYGNKQAGEKFGNMLRRGSSRPWEETLQELTGTRKLDASSMINFFSPLFRYIRKENRKNNEYIGWRDKQRVHSSSKNLVGLPLKPKKGSRHKYNVSKSHIISITLRPPSPPGDNPFDCLSCRQH